MHYATLCAQYSHNVKHLEALSPGQNQKSMLQQKKIIQIPNTNTPLTPKSILCITIEIDKQNVSFKGY